MSKKNIVENTTATAQADPLFTLLSTAGDGGIERMEARGTAQLCESSVLPSDGLVVDRTRMECYADWAEKCGIKVLGLVEGDSIFVNVELPAGWKQERTGHGMWNSLVDEKGRKRASIFYKAAFYDRSAFIRPEARYSASIEYSNDGRPLFAAVKDCGAIIWQGQELDPESDRPWEESDKGRDQAQAWLQERHPEWRDVSAYWGDE